MVAGCQHLALPFDVAKTDAASNVIVGLAELHVSAPWTPLVKLPAHLQEQYDSWRHFFSGQGGLEGFYFIDVVGQNHAQLRTFQPVQQCTDRRGRGFVVPCEEEQPERIAAELRPWPVWATSVPTVIFRLPFHLSCCLASGGMNRFLVPQFRSVPALRIAWPLLGIDDLPCLHTLPSIQGAPSFNIDFAQQLASLLRDITMYADVAEVEGLVERTYEACAALQAIQDSLHPAALAKMMREVRSTKVGTSQGHSCRAAFNTVFMVNCLLCCSLLQNDASLAESIQRTIELVVPSALRGPILDLVQVKTLPRTSTISRWRLLLDTAFMEHRRRLLRQSDRSVHWLMLDSSPQGSFDYEMVLCCSARVEELPHLMFKADKLLGVREKRDDMHGEERPGSADDLLEQERRTMHEMRRQLCMHRMPPVALGSGRTTVVDKFGALMHTLALEADGPTSLERMSREVASITTDMGTEFSLNRIGGPAGVPISDVLPYFAEPDPGADPFAEVDDWDDVAPMGPMVTLAGSLPIAGVLHIISGLASRTQRLTPDVEASITKLQAVANLVRRRASCDRLCERCFSTVAGRGMQHRLRAFSGKIHKQRWGTVALCISDILEIRNILCFGWSKDAYQDGRPDEHRPGNAEFSVSVDQVDEAITSPEWWGMMMALDRLHRVVITTQMWSESCACHWGLDRRAATPQELAVWDACPMRGRRNPELAAGGLFKLVQDTAEDMGSTLMLDLPTELDQAAKGKLLQVFEMGRASIVFAFTLKLSSMLEPPWLILAAAHHVRETACAAIRKCLESTSRHPLIVELQTGDLRAEAEQALDGHSFGELPSLLCFQGKLRFGFSVERAVEGLHSYIHRYWQGAPCHTLAYDSLKLREKEVKEALVQTGGLAEISGYIQKHRNWMKCVACLGMQSHPSAALATHPWDPIWWKIVYRGDPWSTQRRQPPSVRIPPPDDQPPAPPAVEDGDAAGAPEAAPDAAEGPAGVIVAAGVAEVDAGPEDLWSQ